MSKSGSERRRHQVYMTKHTEYHLRGDECVGVRDRGSQLWILDHAALRLRALSIPTVAESAKWLGRRLQFWGRRTDVLTSPVVDIDRPNRKIVGNYVSQARGGEIDADAPNELLVSCPA